MKRRTRSITAAVLSIPAHFIHAADASEPDLYSISLEQLMDIRITSATKTSQKTSEAPSVIDVITREQIDDYGWTSLNAILYQQAGFGPAQDYERRTVGSRGAWESWNNNHLLLQVDGISMNDNYIGTAFTWDITPLFMVKNVEVLRGPGSALYGSSATNGVITINTLSAEDLDNGGEVKLRYADDGGYLAEGVGGLKNDCWFSVVAGYSMQTTPGNEVRSYDVSGRNIDANGSGTLEKFKTQDERDNWYGWLKLQGEGALEGLTIQYHDQFWKYQTVYGYGFWIPDRPDDDKDERRILTLAFAPESDSKLTQKYALRWQEHAFRWDMRLYPPGAFDGLYPFGATEYVSSSVEDVFGRAEFGYALPRGMGLLAGVELDQTVYNGDHRHYANYDPDNGGAPTPDGSFIELGPMLDVVKGNPMTTVAPYLQFSSGDLLGEKLKLTLGGRYDATKLRIDPGVRAQYAGTPDSTRHFDQFDPRLALVYAARDDLTIKFMAGSAFRAPSIAEIGGAHNYFVGAEPLKLKPEKVTTTEFAADWRINDTIDWRANIFEIKYEDFISSSPTTLNASANLFTLKTRGIESEWIVEHGNLSGYLNYSYAKRIDEDVSVTDIAASEHEITWQPSHRANLGVVYRHDRLRFSLNGHYEGSVERRDSDVGVQTNVFGARTLDLDRYRPRQLDSWVTLDGKASYGVAKGVELFVGATNLANTRDNVLAKNGAFPFDYQQEGRTVYGGISLKF